MPLQALPRMETFLPNSNFAPEAGYVTSDLIGISSMTHILPAGTSLPGSTGAQGFR